MYLKMNKKNKSTKKTDVCCLFVCLLLPVLFTSSPSIRYVLRFLNKLRCFCCFFAVWQQTNNLLLQLNFHLFVVSFWQVMILAFPVVLAGTYVTACIAYFIFPYDWSWSLSLTVGCILSATDPVAVSALLNELGAPPRLKMLISGESLMNDGSAVVFYTIFSASFLYELGIAGLGSTTTVATGFVVFFRMALGGMAVGIAFGLALVVILFYLDRRFEKEEVVLQVTATVTMGYLSFYTSEVACKMSGVIAVVMCGTW
jgi:NhaP-type Na+/H+ or K+/H+ antiporter